MKRLRKRIILVGKAASGKDYLRDEFIKNGYRAQISVTTRPMRTGEVNGDTYHFLTEEQWNTWTSKDLFWERKLFNGWRYGTLKTEWTDAELFIFTPSGVSDIPVNERNQCHIIYIDVPDDIRRKRLAERSDSDSTERRMEADNDDFANFTDWDSRIHSGDFDSKLVVKAMEMMYGTAKNEIQS